MAVIVLPATVPCPNQQIAIQNGGVGPFFVAGGGADSQFVVDFNQVRQQPLGSMRGRTVQVVNIGTAFTTISAFEQSLDGVRWESVKTIQPATIGANTTEAAVAAMAVTTATLTSWVAGRDFRFLRITTTGAGDATSGFAFNVGL